MKDTVEHKNIHSEKIIINEIIKIAIRSCWDEQSNIKPYSLVGLA